MHAHTNTHMLFTCLYLDDEWRCRCCNRHQRHIRSAVWRFSFFFFFYDPKHFKLRVKIGGNKAENTQVSISDSCHLPALAPSNLLSRLPSLLVLPSSLSSPSLRLSVLFFLFCFCFFILWSLCHPNTKHSPSSPSLFLVSIHPSVRLHLSVSIDQTGFLLDLHTVLT